MERVAGFVIMGFVLIVASDFPTTAPMAVAFAWLIFVSSALIVGPAAFANLQTTLAGVTANTKGP